ncbi:HPr(Ser) kinase/phosphatase [Verrucomicrobiales bacterium]|nr:HPr(Ser) kinase/phosphatase [Verrucomicrobiales bacterium]
MSEDFPVPRVSEDAAVVLDKNQNTSKAPVKRLSAMSVREFYGRYAEPLQMTLVGSESGFDRRIIEPELNRPGLALAGFYTYFAEQRIQVIGNAEHSYLTCLEGGQGLTRFRELCRQAVPCLILARGHSLPQEFMDEAHRARLTIFQTEMPSMHFLNSATIRLQWAFAPTTSEHGSMVDIHGIGVLIKGASGTGKSETVVGLIDHGASLVADDTVRFSRIAGGDIVGTAPELGRSHMEVRGLGLINVMALYGIGAVRLEKALNVVITLRPAEDLNEVERVGLTPQTYRILGLDLPYLELPVAPGRDLAKLIEVAAMDVKLKVFGHDTPVEFNARLLERMRDHRDR